MTPTERIKAARADLLTAQKDLVEALQSERSRRRGALNRALFEIRQMLSPDVRYFSQAGQDAVVDQVLKHKRGGTFLDIGGYDGVTGSNTFFLEVFRGWTGLLVEPVPANLKNAREVRRCPCLGCAVAAEAGEAAFIEVQAGFTQMSGLAATYDPGLLETVRADPRHAEEIIRVPTRTLANLFEEAGTPRPDFVSLDIEGGEIAVLETLDFDRYRPRLWAIENNTGSSDLPNLMRERGYDLIEFCGQDDIYHDRRAINPDRAE